MNLGINRILNWFINCHVSKFFKREHCKHDLSVAFVVGKILVLLLLISSINSFGQVTIWEEDFESYNINTGIDGTGNIGDYPASVTKWTIDATGTSLSDNDDFLKVNSECFQGKDLHGKGVWFSESINISNFTNIQVSSDFWKYLGTMELTDSINFYYRLDGGGWTAISLLNDNISTTPQTYSVSGLNGNNLELKVEIILNIGGWENYAFDNVLVEGTLMSPPSCTTLISPTDGETDLALDGDLTWNSTTGATSYEINFGTDSPPTNIENGTDLGNVLSYTPATSLDVSTTYYWQIIPKNSNGSATGCSIWSFTTEDCSAGSSTEDEYIDRVQIETIDNNNSGYSINGYGDFTSLSTDLSQGLTGVQLTLTYGVAYSDDDIGVWVDWNQDGDFNDTGENVVCQVGISFMQETYLFDVPASALIGSTTMRIRMKYDNADCGIPCGITTYGEVEDYTINVLPYCVSSGNMDYNTSITLVNFNTTINNVTAKPSAYNDYTSLSTDLTMGNSYDLTVNLNTDGDYTINAIAWIDWNQDGTFNTTDEEYELGTTTNNANGITTNSPLSIAVPAAAVLGNTRMRVSAKYASNPTACETDFDGEVEDYSINIQAACTAPDVPTLSATSTTICNGVSTTLSVSSGNLNDADYWQWYSGSCGGTAVGTGVSISVSPTSTTTYYARGEGSCDGTTCGNITITVADIQIPLIADITDATCPNSTDGAIDLSVPFPIQFDDPDYIDINNTLLSNRSAFTLEGWIKVDLSTVGSRISLFGQNDAIEFGFTNSSTLTCWSDGGGSVATNSYPSDNLWHHVAVAGDGTDMRLYIDGTLVSTGGSPTGNYGTDTNFSSKIGKEVWDPTGGVFPGQMIKVGFWSTALSSTDISNMASGYYNYTGSETGLLAGYNFYEGTGTTLGSEISGTDGTFSGTPTWIDNYTYSWTKTGDAGFSATTQDLSGVTSGIYNVTVTNSLLGCPNTDSWTINHSDTQDPTITCATPAASYNNDAGECYYTVTDNSLNPTATDDNCVVASVENDFNSTNTLNGAQFPVGTTTVIWTVTDAAGNTATCQYDVVVNDNENPSITCPADISTSPDAGLCTYSGGIGTPLTTDNCPGETASNNAPANFPIGITTVIWTVTDPAGNTATCSQTVTVTDDEDPTITCATPAASYNNDLGECYYTIPDNSLNPTATDDNCVVASVENDFNSTNTLNGAQFSVGTTTVIWTVTDAAGNDATCQYDVVVNDNEDPSITCPANISTNPDAGLCTYSGGIGMPITTDNCPGETASNNAPGIFPIGITTVIWTVTDAAGNTATCSQTVTVTDDENPTITCATPAASYSNDAGQCYYTVLDNSLNPTATDDNCVVASVINDFNSTNTLNGAQFPVGATTVIWTVTDAAGNTATCQYDVVVNDNEDPSITCPANISTNPDAGFCTYSGGIGTPLNTDNCPGETASNNAPTNFPIGITTVIWTVTDAAGNTATCNQTVTIQPAQIIDIRVENLGNSCQSGETGSTTTITWDITLVQGSNSWTYDYTIKEGLTTLQTGTNVNVSGNIQISYPASNTTATDKTYTITLTNVKDNCGVAETNTGNNSDSATLFGVPDTSDITTN